jgi:hypothetical protein
MVSAKPKLTLTVALGRTEHGRLMVLMLCPGPNLLTLMVAFLIICVAPLALVGIAAALILKQRNACTAERTHVQMLGISSQQR